MGKELFVRHISFGATEEDMWKLFSVAGKVTSVHLVTDPRSGEFKGCGYVRMATEEDAKDAITKLDGALLGNRVIAVSEARPQKPKAGPPGGGKRRPGRESRPGRGRR